MLELALTSTGILIQTNQSLTFARMDCSVDWMGATPNSPSTVAAVVPVEARNIAVSLYDTRVEALSLTVGVFKSKLSAAPSRYSRTRCCASS